MPRVNHVQRAQQRYATKPVIDPETGVQKATLMMNSRTGQPKKTKRGELVYLRITERDLERPLPMPKCDYPECKHETREIAVGTPYKWIEPSGMAVRNRHADCPMWKVWEYSSSLSARIAQITEDTIPDFDSLEYAQQWAADKAQEIRDLAEEKRESSNNIEEGFGHPTYQSEELSQQADDLDSWADDVENVDLPEFPEFLENDTDSDETEEKGEAEEVEEAEEFEGKLSEWQSEVVSAIEEALSNSPV